MRWPRLPAESVQSFPLRPAVLSLARVRGLIGAQGEVFQRFGSYRKPSDFKRIPAFDAATAKQTCSRQTFSTTHHPSALDSSLPSRRDLPPAPRIDEIARSSHCSKTSVTRMAERPRPARHPLSCALPGSAPRPDGNHRPRSFRGVHRSGRIELLGIGTAVGSESWFVYDIDPAPNGEAGGAQTGTRIRRPRHDRTAPTSKALNARFGA